MQGVQPHLYRIGNVDLFVWDPVRATVGSPHGRSTRNFGDVLGRVLVERVAASRNLDIDSTLHGDEQARALVAVGSVLHFAPRGATVWGTGVNFKMASRLNEYASALDVRAVRGPVSARVLERAGCEVPAVYGDPVLLLPYFFPEVARWRALDGSEALAVPNLNDFEMVAAQAAALGIDVVDPRAPSEHVLKRIASAAFVFGSSLHAVVVADALGVPARLVASRSEHVLKYRDYLAGTGRATTRIAKSLDEALSIGAHEAPSFSASALLEAFPEDLWGAARPAVADVRDRGPLHLKSSNRWDPLIDGGETDEVRIISVSRMRSSLGTLRGVAEGLLQGEEQLTYQAVQENRALHDAFNEALRIRESAGSLAMSADFADDDADLLTAIDLGQMEQAVRATWLRIVGPHATARLLSGARSNQSVLLLSLRPGRLLNELEEWRLCRLSDDVVEVISVIPVFDLYRHQWSIDTSVVLGGTLHLKSSLEALSVQYRERGGDWISVNVEECAHGEVRLTEYPVKRGTLAQFGCSDDMKEHA